MKSEIKPGPVFAHCGGDTRTIYVNKRALLDRPKKNREDDREWLRAAKKFLRLLMLKTDAGAGRRWIAKGVGYYRCRGCGRYYGRKSGHKCGGVIPTDRRKRGNSRAGWGSK